jgi:hypothetical protein
MNAQETSKTNSRNVGKQVFATLAGKDPHSIEGIRIVATLCYRDAGLWDSLQSFPSSMRLTTSPYYVRDIETWLERVSLAILDKVARETPGTYTVVEREPLPGYTPNAGLVDAMYMRSDSKAFTSIGRALIIDEKMPTFRIGVAGIGKLVLDNSLRSQGKRKSRKKLANRTIRIENTVSHIRVLAQYGEYLHCVGRAKIARKVYARVGVKVGQGTAKIERQVVSVHDKKTGDFLMLGIEWREWNKDKYTGERTLTGREVVVSLAGDIVGHTSEYTIKRVSTGTQANKAVVEFILHTSQFNTIQDSMREKDWRKRPIITTGHVVSRYMKLLGYSLLHSAGKLFIPSLDPTSPYNPDIQLAEKPHNPAILSRLDTLRDKLGIAS